MSTRLGIVGAGQLALYLCEAAQVLGCEVAILAEAGDAPALHRADWHGRYSDGVGSDRVVEDFIAHCDVVTFDKEAIPEPILVLLAAAQEQGRIKVRPGIGTLQILKDKGTQKEWLCQQKLPTLPHCILADNNLSVEDLIAKLGSSVVQKTRSGGFDGRGVQILAPLQTREQLWNVPSIVEPYLPDCAEIGVVVARSHSGELQAYPPVSMAFDPQLNSLLAVTSPAEVVQSQWDAAIDLACAAITALDGVGVFAVEFFTTPTGDLLVNEISPRVHNSGHLTLDACNVSQFEQHVRAVIDAPLLPIQQATAAAMLNILDAQVPSAGFPSAPALLRFPELSATAYWYGKTPGNPGRKMGHITALGANPGEALAHARQALGKLADGSTEWAA
ncbi:MAG: ATP-grasp domain-containing protein [Halioglobus sp.]